MKRPKTKPRVKTAKPQEVVQKVKDEALRRQFLMPLEKKESKEALKAGRKEKDKDGEEEGG